MRRWDALMEGYLNECQIQGLMPVTILGRRAELERFGNWLKRRRPKLDLTALETEVFTQYVSERSAFRSRWTIYGIMGVLRGMGEYLVRQSVWTKNPMRWMKGPRVSARMRLPRRIGKEEMARLWAAAEARTERTRALARCVLAVLYGTGLRRGEMERLDLRHWDREAGVLRIDGRKTGQERQVPVGAGVWRCLEAYLPQRQKRLEAAGRLEEEPALFVNCRGGRLDGASITALVQTCCRRAQIPYVSMHQFRHSCASDLLENGVKLPQVQKVLGHAHIGSTMRYLDVTHGARTEAIRRHPINEFLTTPAVERKVAG